MLKKILHWKSIFIMTVILLFFLLFQVLKNDFMALPDSGFSRGIYLDQLQVGTSYKNYYADHFDSITKGDSIYIITSDENGLKISQYNLKAELISQFSLADYKSLDQFSAFFKGENLIINYYSNQTRNWNLLQVDLKSKTAILEKSETLDNNRALTLNKDFVIYATEDALKITNANKTWKIDSPQFLETIDYFEYPIDQTHWIAYTEYIDGEYLLNLKHLDKNFNTLSDYNPYFSFGASGAIIPHELELNISNQTIHIMSVNTDKKSGVNMAYYIESPISDPKLITSKYFSAYTYSLQPTFYSDLNDTKLIISAKTNIGRVEIGSEGKFQNLIALNSQMNQALSLTKSTSPALAPQIHKLNGHQYLFYLQINQGIAKLMMSSDDPYIIEKSLSSSLSENINLLMTVLTTFLPLSYIGLIVEAYVLTPVLIVVVLISMFWLTWAERNGNKLLMASLLIHCVVKTYFLLKHILESPDVFSNLPNFLDSPFKLFSWCASLTLISLYCLNDYRIKHEKTHYIFKYFFFNIIDLLFFTMLFTPYYLLV